MRILLVHNRYRLPGGEDNVFESEGELLSKHGHIIERLVFDNSAIKTFIGSLLSGLKGIYSKESAKTIRKKIEQFDPDVIHVHNFFYQISPSIFFIAKKYNIPIVHTLHNYRLICPSTYLFCRGQVYDKCVHSFFPMDAILKGAYQNSKLQTALVAIIVSLHKLMGTWKNKVDLYIALSNFAKAKFKESTLSIPEERLVVKYNFVQDLGMGDSVRRNFFLFMGRLSEEKGVQSLLDAARLHNFELVILGDGPMRQLVSDAEKENPKILYMGFQNKLSIASYLKKCKALIVPSIWYEGYPLSILEAFSTGTPVIASDLGVIPEIIENGVNGLLFKAGSGSDMVSKIVEIDTKPELAKRIGDNARSAYLMRYTPEKNYGILISIYNKALAHKQQEQNELVQQSILSLSKSEIS